MAEKEKERGEKDDEDEEKEVAERRESKLIVSYYAVCTKLLDRERK